jgi:hypothetical protein
MATERLSMRQIREILRQKWSLGHTHREVAQSLGISSGAVGTTVPRARAAGLAWGQIETLSDEALHARVYGPPTPPTRQRPIPDCAALHAERRKPGVTSSCSIWNTSSSIRTATGTPNSATSTVGGSSAGASRCARSIAPARSASSTTPARSRGSSRPPPAR